MLLGLKVKSFKQPLKIPLQTYSSCTLNNVLLIHRMRMFTTHPVLCTGVLVRERSTYWIQLGIYDR